MMERIRFDEKGLVPAVVQDAATGAVLMLAYMNRESLGKTIETGTTWFYSRSRQELWNKGATSGHMQQVREMYYDCDGDTLLIKVEQTGSACHEGTFSCFSRKFGESESTITDRCDIIIYCNAIFQKNPLHKSTSCRNFQNFSLVRVIGYFCKNTAFYFLNMKNIVTFAMQTKELIIIKTNYIIN